MFVRIGIFSTAHSYSIDTEAAIGHAVGVNDGHRHTQAEDKQQKPTWQYRKITQNERTSAAGVVKV